MPLSVIEPRLSALDVLRQRTSIYPAPGLTRDLFPKQEPLSPPSSKAPGHKHVLHVALTLKCDSPERGTQF